MSQPDGVMMATAAPQHEAPVARGPSGGGGGAARDPRQSLDPVACVQVAVLAALLAAAFWAPIRHVLVFQWINSATWTYCWLVPVFSIYFVMQHRDALRAAPRRASPAGLLVLLAGMGLYFAGVFRQIGYFQGVAIVVTLFGLTWYLLGNAAMRVLWFPVAFLLLAVPLPPSLYGMLTQPLQILAAKAARVLLMICVPGLFAEQAGVHVDYLYRGATGTLHVDQGCSGMRTQMALLTLGLVVAYTGDRPNWQRLVMLATCVPIAIFVNVLRVTVTGWLQVHGYNSLASGTPHALLGIVLFFGVALGLFVLVGYVLQHLFVDVPDGEGDR